MLEIGDTVRIVDEREAVYRIVGFTEATMQYELQLGNDAGTKRWVAADRIELVEKGHKAEKGSGFVPKEPLF